MKKDALKKIITAAAAFALLFAVIVTASSPAQYELAVGDIAPVDFFAQRNITDKLTTEARRDAAGENSPVLYRVDAELTATAVARINDFFADVRNARLEQETRDEVFAGLKAQSAIQLSDGAFLTLAKTSSAELENLAMLSDAVEKVMSEGVEDKAGAVEKAAELMNVYGLGAAMKAVELELLEKTVSVNKYADHEATRHERERAVGLVPSVEYKKNQIIARKGEILSEAQAAMLSELGFLQGTSPLSLPYIAGTLILLLLLFGVVYSYMRFCGDKKLWRFTSVLISAIISVVTVGMVFLFSRVLLENAVYALPVGMCAALIAVMLDARFAALLNLCVSLLCAIAAGQDWGYGMCLALGGAICALSFSAVNRRSRLILATVTAALGYGAVFGAFSLLESKEAAKIVSDAFAGLTGGFLSGILAIGTMPFWESVFDVLTVFKLGELASPENKLLKRLLIEAPGTYHHSLTVANMAESAAREIGANPLLARVGAYYHDIGKLKRPFYFKENQYAEDPHDQLSPKGSAEIIIRHVSDGLELARQARLPSAVRDIIAQHHGTTPVAFFLHKARATVPEINEEDFKYKGKLPVSREAAIVMLADSCEAAVRSMEDKSEDAVRSMVEKIIGDRLTAGQLSSCDMTLGDIKTAADAFIKTFGGFFHKRIKYPEKEIRP